ncbi:transcriptional regulator GcvA [Pikeienuella piscinae]|uniref:Transcriptional regulator GcvA n=1 Tax=Pikeienuella piscinae TaxID=2748098 RepID=A0A7L5BYB8_9RHOB|nr:transcriptional regulator GcvA [Pikeienuella piscinae]QIE55838.1 transcriptional regulator GcvA [Pikeienuella piscinae]
MALTDRLPPLTALRAFDAAARHMSFARAAEELYVTPAALSYQIKNLETDLGVQLFRRLNRAVELTEAGRLLAPGVADGFEALKAAVRNVNRMRDGRGLVLTAGPAFTAKWLAPRIYRFVERRPDIEVRLVASLKKLDFNRDEVDAAIRFTRHNEEPGCYVETMVHELMSPVCAPALAARLKNPSDLIGAPLVHDESLALMQKPPNWGDWLKVAGVEMDWRRGPKFSNADQALEAAAAGGGVALGRLSLATTDLRSGRLVAPFDIAIDTGAHFNFVCPAGMETRPEYVALLDWLRDELSDESAPGEGMRIVRID